MAFRVIPVAWVVVRAKEDNTLEPPTTPPKLMAPTPALTVKALAPLIVLLKEMALPVEALPVEAKVIELPKVIAPV